MTDRNETVMAYQKAAGSVAVSLPRAQNPASTTDWPLAAAHKGPSSTAVAAVRS